MQRLNHDEYFMKIAKVVSERSTCLPHRSQVGAVLVKDNHIIASGYNGPPSGFPHCDSCYRDDSKKGENLENCPAVHAEQNVIIQAALHGASPDGGTIYCTHFPCVTCLRMVINSKVKRVVYGKPYDMENEIKKKLMSESSMSFEKFTGRERVENDSPSEKV